MAHYDFMVAGRWRNKEAVKAALDAVRASGKSAYCFIENTYEGEKVEFSMDPSSDTESIMQRLEALPSDDPHVKRIFDTDMNAERDSDSFLLVLPAGTSGHIEAGAAYGMGKKCYAVGPVDKTETLYCIFERIFPDLPALEAWLKEQPDGE